MSAAVSLKEMSVRVPSNYREHNIDPAGVRIAAKAHPLNPLEIGVSSNSIGRVLLAELKVKKLKGLLDSMLKKWPTGTNASAGERDITFMVNLFGQRASTTPFAGWRGVALHQQREAKDAQHKSTFHEFFMYSCVLVGCYV